MIRHGLILILISILFACCEDSEIKSETPISTYDTIPPKIILNGNENDTAYLHTTYTDPGARINEKRGENCLGIMANVSGTINTDLPGTYFLKYDGKDNSGNKAATVTRTVHVVENNTAFLNGIYNVAYTCTSTTGGSPNSTVTTNNYIASVTSSSKNNCFEINTLKIGAEDIIPNTSLNGYSIDVYYCSPDYYWASSYTGTLSSSRNTFTIESTVYQFHPNITYVCKNVYTNTKVD